MKGFLKFLLRLVFTVSSAFLASLAFPSPWSDVGFSPLAFISLIPIFIIVRKSKWWDIWLEGLLYGFTYYMIYNYWLETFHPLAILIAPILESVQYMLLFIILKIPSSIRKKRAYIPETLLYVTYLFLTQKGFLGYPYGNMSAALWCYPVFIQSVDIFGIWGLCLLLSFSQSLIAELILRYRNWKEYKTDLICIVSAFLLNTGYGVIRYNQYENREPEYTMDIAAIQHSSDSWKGGFSQYKKNLETLERLTTEAMEESPDMVVWSETAFVPSVAWHTNHPSSARTSNLVDNFVNFGKELGVPLVTGNPEGEWDDKSKPPILPDGTWNKKDYNTVIFFNEGKIFNTYRKQHLVPFTEHFPYQKQMPRLTALLEANDYKWWEEGHEATVFEYGDLKFGTPICFEDIFGYLSAEFVRNGADLLINLSNDSWSGSVPAEMQHMQLALFRAVENRVPLLRSTNSGMTCLITPSGNYIDPLEPFTVDWNIYEVPIGQKRHNTFYTTFPDLFAYLTIVLAALSIPTFLYIRNRDRKIEAEEKLFRKYEELFREIDDRYEC